jgi:hypothetical protein
MKPTARPCASSAILELLIVDPPPEAGAIQPQPAVQSNAARTNAGRPAGWGICVNQRMTVASTNYLEARMKKPTKTAAQLEDMISERIGLGVLVKVHEDLAYGYTGIRSWLNTSQRNCATGLILLTEVAREGLSNRFTCSF